MKRALRVLLVSTYYKPVIGGAEASTERLAEFLVRAGHHVRLLTRRPSNDVAWSETMNGVEVRRLPPTGRRSAAGKWLWLPWLFAALLREEADVILVSDQRGSGMSAWAAARLRGRPFLIQPHTDGSLDGRHPARQGLLAVLNRALTWPMRSVYVRADAIAGITRSVLREARDMGVPESRLYYLPNTLDTRLFAPAEEGARRALRESFGWSDDEIVFLFAGRLSLEKGLKELLTAWRDLSGQHLRLALVGPSMPAHAWDLSAWIAEFVSSNALQGRVSLWGGVTPDQLARLMAAADVAVHPSHFESHGLAALEAMACGLPIVATSVGGFREFVADGVNGLLVPPHDAKALSAALREMAALVSNPVRRADWSRAARSAALAFDQDEVLPRYVRVLEELATARRAPVHGT